MQNSELNVQDLPPLLVCTSNYCSRRVRRKKSFIVAQGLGTQFIYLKNL